jgi:predicted RND superfamily exporter protein
VSSPQSLARRYVVWLRKHAIAMIAGYALLFAGALYLIAFRLPLFADFSYLLPQDAPAVKDLRKLESRVRASDTMLVIVQGMTPQLREQAVAEMIDGINAAKSPLVERVTGDEKEIREFYQARRHLMVELPDLIKARDALKKQIDDAKLKANPLFIDLGDEGDAEKNAEADKKQLDELREKKRNAEERLYHPTNVSKDGLIGKIEVATAFPSTDAKRGEQLLETLSAVRTRVMTAHPGVIIGFTGGAVTALSEHNAITSGMVLSSLVTAVLVALLLAIYFRSATLLVLLVGTVSIATAAAFGAAAVTVGHLNAATAFLGAIIAGNGINYGIFLIARYLEERRTHDVDESLATAIHGTLRPTAVASLGASIAYGSLAATSFKGFADFAVIGAIGMMLCWVSSYTLLPALMVRFGRNTRIYHGSPVFGSLLARLLGFRRSQAVVAVACVLFAGAGVIVYRYIAADPFEYTISNLRSKGDDAVAARDWMQLSDKRFGRGISGRTYIAADRLDQVPMILEALAKMPAIGAVDSLPAYVPADQDKRLAVLDEIRSLLDQALVDLDDKAKQELTELRPPDGLTTFGVNDLPPTLRDKFTEKDGKRVGYLIAVRPSEKLDEWKGQDLLTFANAVRELHLPDGETVTTSGASVIFADIIESIERDGPVVTSVALGGLIIMVVLLVGRNRRAIAVMLATIGGAILMIAVCALLQIKVNFLDFVALPITLGLGIDYAINVAHRHDEEDIPDPITTLRTSGSAVLICSMTTMIGYGSLLVSENLAIRGFGTASLIGEVTTVLTALVLVPALLALGHRPPQRSHLDS